jgi:uncharacterized protein with NRDE domain
MKKYIFLLVFIVLIQGCTNRNHAYKALNSLGYTDIQYTGYNFFECSDDDFYHTGFRAKNPNGKLVTGTVCSGLLFKGSTVRF